MDIVALIFLVLALVMVVTAFFPSWNFDGGFVFSFGRLLALLLGLIVLYLIFLIVESMFGHALVIGH